MEKDITKPTFLQYLEPINFEKFNDLILKLGVDKYVKKLSTSKMISLLIYSQLFNVESLTHLSTVVNSDEDLSELINLDSISTSQLSRKLRDLEPELIENIFKQLVVKAIAEKGVNEVREKLKHINIIDASTISMAMSQYPWADFRETKAGVKINLRLKFCDESDKVMPDKTVISPAKEADRTKMEDLVVTAENALNIFDRGYVDYKKFDEYTDNNILFLSRLKGNAKIEYIETETKYIDGKEIKDSIVELGTKNINQMENNLRLLEIPDDRDPDKIIKIITNDFERSAKEISDLYRNRWKIELFFKWIKQHLQIKKFFGFSENAVENQIISALITHLLLVLFKEKVQTKKSLLKIKRIMDICKYDSLKKLINKLKKPPSRTSKGRQKFDHEKMFELTKKQVIEGNTDHLYDESTYNPTFL